MKQKIKTILLTLTLVGGLNIVLPAVAGASPNYPAAPKSVAASFQSDACNGISQLGGTGCGGNSTSGVSKLLSTTLNLLSLAAGFIAVVMIIISGIKFMTANGDSSGIASARSALIYALVGVIVAAMAQFLVHFVIGKVT
jgi:Type IV secretion system pilin